ncbi:MAG: D-alanyl-D-alanine carboxypeptidase family protein [Patescibacteria group bacterium]|jgi:D-alanyl-D-alanine carboxypeptidase
MKGKLLVILILISIPAVLFLTKKKESIDLISGCVPLTGNLKEYRETLIYNYDFEPNWKPITKMELSSQPEVIGSAGLLVDIGSGEVLFEKNPHEQRKIASLVKIMTAVVALEHAPLDREIEVSYEAAVVGENAMGLTPGETYTLEELLYGLILTSGNDAAYAIAEGVAGDEETFVGWMNIKAKELGLKDTYFADPSGLDDSTYSTAFDLVKLTKYALKDPEFRRIVSTFEMEVFGDEHKYIYLQNQTNLLTTYPGVAGVKTGFTEAAGLCLVTYAKNDGKELVGVVLNSIDRKGDMILMLDWGFSSLGINITHNLL